METFGEGVWVGEEVDDGNEDSVGSCADSDGKDVGVVTTAFPRGVVDKASGANGEVLPGCRSDINVVYGTGGNGGAVGGV